MRTISVQIYILEAVRSLWLYRTRFVFMVTFALLLLQASTSAANSELPIATTVPLTNATSSPGMVVRFDTGLDAYRLSTESFDEAVYGVVGERPAIVFMTASNTIPIVTQGVSGVLVDTSHNGAIARGDLLTTSPELGVAMRASLETNEVFAIALEDVASGEGLVMAEVGVPQATKIQQERQAAAEAATAAMTEEKKETSLVRVVIAIGLTVLALGFLLYSFRSILSSGILSVGRNPRARTSVVWISMGSMVMVLILVTLVVLVAIGVLVLPV